MVQALMVDTALTLAQAQHVRELQQLREQAGLESREQLAHFQAQLADEKCRGQKLQQTLRTQAQQASTQIGLQQVVYCATGCTQSSHWLQFNRHDLHPLTLLRGINRV